MKPMILRTPAPCCGTKTLIWDKKKWHFVCPCGEMLADTIGRKIDRKPQMRSRGRLKKGKLPKEVIGEDDLSWMTHDEPEF